MASARAHCELSTTRGVTDDEPNRDDADGNSKEPSCDVTHIEPQSEPRERWRCASLHGVLRLVVTNCHPHRAATRLPLVTRRRAGLARTYGDGRLLHRSGVRGGRRIRARALFACRGNILRTRPPQHLFGTGNVLRRIAMNGEQHATVP